MLGACRTTDKMLMVRPHDFGFNEETGLDNEFQKRPTDSEKQIRRLEQYGTILPVALDTIESVGGGSARCMMAEIFS